MLEEDAILWHCNESELLWLARLQGLPLLRCGLPQQELIEIVTGARPFDPSHLAGTITSRSVLEDFIQKNFDRIRGQLPGCNGKCRTFLCTEGKHMGCYLPSEPLLL